MTTSKISRFGRRALPGLVVAGAALATAGCNTDKLVAVTDPNQLRPGDLTTAQSVPALVQGAIRQFVGGYSGFGDDAFLSMSAVITDEMYWGDTFTTRQAADIRALQPTALGNISDPAFTRLQQARLNARRAFAGVDAFTSAGTATADAATKSTLRTIEAFTYVTLSEGWCGSVPFSVLPDTGSLDPSLLKNGTPLNTAQMNDTAVARFNEALTLNANNNLAKLGKARALLNNGRYAEAATAVAGIPTTYVYRLEHSSNAGSENNPMASLMQNGRYGISNLEGGATSTGAALRPDLLTTTLTAASAEGLPFRAAADPRIPFENRGSNGACFSSSIRCYLNDNYIDFNADVPLASGIEARLVEAEAALQAGQPATMLTKLNELRASVSSLLPILYPSQRQTFPASGAPSLAPLTDPASATGTTAEQLAARRDLLFRERAFWMYNTGHRLGDLRRLVRNYGLTSTQAFPSGPYFRGGTYGNDVSYPIPFNEQNNDQFSAAACVTTKA